MKPPESPSPQTAAGATFLRWRGAYLSEEALAVLPFADAPTNRVAFLFPGQGDFPPGRAGEWTARLPELRAHVTLADAFCQRHELGRVSDYLADRSGNHEPIVAMLALLTFSCGVSACLKAQGIRPAACAGFSFGELSALVAAELVSFETALELAWIRDQCCPAPFSAGGMIFVGAPASRLTEWVEGNDDVAIANLCSPQKTVVSVRSDVSGWVRRFRRARLPALALKTVPQPYHTVWLAEATARTRKGLMNRALPAGEAVCHFVSSHKDWNHVGQSPSPSWLADAVADPLCQPVDFPRQVHRLAELGIDSVIEVGLGGGLADFIRDLSPVNPTRFWQWEQHVGWTRPATESSPPRYELALKDHPLLGRLTRALARITGYELESVSLEQRFQEDFGIDSIKKAEVLFYVAEEAGLKPAAAYASNEIGNLADALRYLTAGPQELPRPAAALKARETRVQSWAFAWQEASAQPASIEQRPRSWFEVELDRFSSARTPDDLPAPSDEGFNGLLLYSGPQAEPTLEPDTAERFVRNWVQWHQSLWRKLGWRDRPVVLVRAGRSASYVHGLAAFFRSLAKESPDLVFRDLICDEWTAARGKLRMIADAEWAQESDGPVRIGSSGRRLLRPARPPAPAAPASAANSGRWLILGATAATCQTLLPALAQQDQLKEAYLVGRRESEDPGVSRLISDLKADGVRVHYQRSDVSLPGNTSTLLHEAGVWFDAASFGVLHAVGIEASVPWESMDPDIANQVIASKLRPALEILQQTDPLKTRVVFFSSIASLCGNAGQAAYAMANATLNSLAEARPNCLSIAWPAWDGVGMASRPAVMARLNDVLLPLLPATTAAERMGRDLADHATSLRYYSDARDLWLLRDPARLRSGEKDLLGGLHEGFYLRRTFQTESDPWLNDHTVRGVALVPGAFMLQAAITCARRAFGREVLLERFEILSPLAVSKEGRVSWRLRQFFAADDRLSIHAAGDQLETWQAIAQPHTQATVQDTRVALAGPEEAIMPIYGNEGLFHGPAFRVLAEAGFDEHLQARGRLRNPAVPITGNTTADAGIRAFEAAFQLAGLAAFRKTGRISLPVGCEGVQLNDPEAVSIVMLDAFVIENDESRARIRFLNTAGELLGSMERVCMRETSDDA